MKSSQQIKPHRVVIVGGGFAGLQAARKLAPQPLDITLVDRHNYHLFQPLVYQVATGALAPSEICRPFRTIFRDHPNVEILLAEVTGFDLAERRVELRPAEEDVPAPASLEYDSLIVAGGSHYSYFGHNGWQQRAPELKSLEGALDIRGRILTALESAEWERDPGRRRALLTFVVVGAGPTGVEMAGQIAEMGRDGRREYRHADTTKVRVLLVEAADRILTGFPPSLSAKGARELQSLGVTPLPGHTVTDIQEGAVTITTPSGDCEQHAARTVIWAAGVSPSSLADALAQAGGGELDRRGRLIVEADLTVAGHPEVLAIGDMITIRRDGQLRTLPGVAPVAMQQGRHAARVVLAQLQGQRPRPFHYFDKGNLATIGRARGVADLKVVRFSGAPAWITWLGVHLFYLIGFQNRLLVLTSWAFSFFTHGRVARLIRNAPGRAVGPQLRDAPPADRTPLATR